MNLTKKQIFGIIIFCIFGLAVIYAAGNYTVIRDRYFHRPTIATLSPAGQGESIDELSASIQSKILPSDSLNPYFVEQYINNARQDAGLKPLIHSTELANSAKAKVIDMVQKDYFAHTSPDNTQPWDFVRNAGYNYKSVGENLAKDEYKKEQQVVNDWLASPDHRAVIMSSKFCDVGVAIVKAKQFAGATNSFVIVLHAADRHETYLDIC